MGHHESNYQPKWAIEKWLDERLPVVRMMSDQFIVFPTPRNLNYWWTMGMVLFFFLVIQLITGIILVMHYIPHESMAFDSVEHIMRDVNWGWLLRYMHSNGASFFFIAVYIHILRGMFYGSYKAPRELLWLVGVVIYILMMAAAFMGYVLPWGQMSFWGATVITNLFSAIPLVGDYITQWFWGAYAVSQPTLNRFLSLHYLVPMLLAVFVLIHIWALHVVGSNNPEGLDVKSSDETLPFHPYFTMKDMYMAVVFLLVYAFFVFFMSNYMGHPDNYIKANPMVTPAHIVPEWYFLPFYAVLRAIPDKLGGVVAMFGSIIVVAILPWLDRNPIRSLRYRPLAKIFFWVFVVSAVLLGFLGAKPAEGWYVTASRVLTAYWFIYFLVIVPLLSKMETTNKRMPGSITDAVLGGGH
jgi:quinol-cytochrome oxidoreductase complex cytochrome b subunit